MKTGFGRYRPHRASGAFDPTIYGTLVFAWDFSNTALITESGGSVSQVDGAFGTTPDLVQGTGGSQPTTGTRTIGGYNALDFDGSADHMTTTVGALSPPYTIVTVHLFDAALGLQTILSAGAVKYQMQVRDVSGFRQQINLSGALLVTSNTAATTSAATPYIWSSRIIDQHTYKLQQNADAVTKDPSVSTDVGTALIVGADTGPGQYHNGTIALILGYNSDIGDTNTAALFSAINAKWAVY